MPAAVPDPGAGEAAAAEAEGLRLPKVVVMAGWGVPQWAHPRLTGVGGAVRGGAVVQRPPPAPAGRSPRRWVRCPPRRQAAPFALSPPPGRLAPPGRGCSPPPPRRPRTLRGCRRGQRWGRETRPDPFCFPPPKPGAFGVAAGARGAPQALSHPRGTGVWPRSPGGVREYIP